MQQEQEVTTVPVDQENDEGAGNESEAQEDAEEVTAEHIAACFKM